MPLPPCVLSERTAPPAFNMLTRPTGAKLTLLQAGSARTQRAPLTPAVHTATRSVMSRQDPVSLVLFVCKWSKSSKHADPLVWSDRASGPVMRDRCMHVRVPGLWTAMPVGMCAACARVQPHVQRCSRGSNAAGLPWQLLRAPCCASSHTAWGSGLYRPCLQAKLCF